MPHSWFYRSSGNISGPIDFDGLTQLAVSGTLRPNDELRRDDQGDWVPAGSVVGLFPETQEPEELSDLADLDFQLVDSQSDVQAAPAAQFATLDDLGIQIVSEPAAPRTNKSSDSSDPTAAIPVGEQPAAGWFYRVDGDVEGPFSLNELAELASDGLISPDDTIRYGESGAWQRAARVDELAGCFAATVPHATPEAPPRDDAAPCDLETVDSEPDAEPAQPAPAVASPPKADRWFCLIEDVEHGPLTWADLSAMAEHRRIKPETQVKQGDEGDWTAAGAVDGLFAAEAPADDTAASLSATVEIPRPRKEKKRKEKRERGPREPLGPRLKGLVARNKPVVFGGLGLAVIAAAVLFFALGRKVPHDQYVTAMREILNEHYALKKRKADHTEWKPLISKAQTLQAEIQPVLEKSANSKRPELQELLWASQDMLPMLENRAKSPNDHEERFVDHLTNAAKMLELPSDFRSGAPPEKPPAKSKKR